jgi:outer membrane lipoprotein-sorting protein
MPFIGRNGSSSEAKAAVSFLEKSIQASDQIHSMIIHCSVRTDVQDNFALIGKDYPMVAHTITKSFDTPAKWKVEKSGRTVLNDGIGQYLWMPEIKNAIKTGLGSGMAEWFHILLDPSNILSLEEETAKEKNSKISTRDEGGNTYITITSRAEGNFLNNYMQNKSIAESDNRREYVFDSKTKLLQGLKIYLLDKKKETLIFNLDHIDYNTAIDPSTFTISLPEGIEWSVLDLNVTNANLSSISSKKAAELALEGLSKKDFDSNKELWSEYNFVMLKLIASRYAGLQVIEIGEPFKSGLYPGEFVPFEFKDRDGITHKWKLALRNDNPHKVWMVDGGL